MISNEPNILCKIAQPRRNWYYVPLDFKITKLFKIMRHGQPSTKLSQSKEVMIHNVRQHSNNRDMYVLSSLKLLAFS